MAKRSLCVFTALILVMLSVCNARADDRFALGELAQCKNLYSYSGTNRAYFCRARVVYPDAKPYFAIVYVYEALDGGTDNENLINVVKALYLYAQTANAYFPN